MVSLGEHVDPWHNIGSAPPSALNRKFSLAIVMKDAIVDNHDSSVRPGLSGLAAWYIHVL